MLKEFRDALGKTKPFVLQRSNHSDRIEKYLRRNSPAFDSLEVLKIESLLGLNKLRITYNRTIDYIAPGVLMAHGHEGRLYTTAGLTSLNLGIKSGQNMVCGHTHRLGISSVSNGFGGRLNTIWGLEVGHLMDIKSKGAEYISNKMANWQQGFGMLYVEGKHVTPAIVPINAKNEFIADGELW